MNRHHLFEFHDQRWFPAVLRRDLRQLLQYQIVRYNFYAPILPILADALRQSGAPRLIDFGSGEGAVTRDIQRRLADSNCNIDLVLSDLYPSHAEEPQSNIEYFPIPVDARCPPTLPYGMWTFFTSFHHFKPDEARSILRNAVEVGAPIAIFEFTERTRQNLLGTLLSPLAVWFDSLQLPVSKLRHLRMLTILPPFYAWDAFVSHLRTYTPDELRRFVATVAAPHYHWLIGKAAGEMGSITYLIGMNLPIASKNSP